MKPRIFLAAIFLANAIPFTLAPTTQARSDPPGARVTIIDYAFEPAEQTITTGESIAWQNDGQEPHNVIDIGGAWESPALNNGQTYTVTFTTPGSYTYACSIHSGMLGTITIVLPEPPPQIKVYVATIQR